jgi:hypothetical protein
MVVNAVAPSSLLPGNAETQLGCLPRGNILSFEIYFLLSSRFMSFLSSGGISSIHIHARIIFSRAELGLGVPRLGLLSGGGLNVSWVFIWKGDY